MARSFQDSMICDCESVLWGFVVAGVVKRVPVSDLGERIRAFLIISGKLFKGFSTFRGAFFIGNMGDTSTIPQKLVEGVAL